MDTINIQSISTLNLGKPASRESWLALALLAFCVALTGCKTAPPKQFVSAKTGKTFAYVVVADKDEEREPFELPTLGARSADNFMGTDRKAAKTSISAAPTIDRADVAELLTNLPKSDQAMLNHNPPISKSADSDRLPEEEQNVRVQHGLS